MEYVLCTHDADYIEMATRGATHSGIAFGQQHKHGIGDWVRFLELLAALYQPEDMKDRIEYL